ncbi:MAG: YbaK/EbsC family protein [Gemmatimonadota bacterium]|nr:YbaK/EbsC family protein [Gemmatimonadota bacterium]
MNRSQAIRNYDWRALQVRVRQWYDARNLRFVEEPVADIDRNFGIKYSVVRTSTLLIKLRHGAGTTFVIAVTPTTLRTDLTAIRKMYHASTAWIATLGEIQHLTRSVPGCVPAFGSLFGLPVVVDARLRDAPEIFTASGRPGFAVRVPMCVYSTSENPRLLDLRRAPMTVPDFATSGNFAQAAV